MWNDEHDDVQEESAVSLFKADVIHVMLLQDVEYTTQKYVSMIFCFFRIIPQQQKRKRFILCATFISWWTKNI